MNLTRITLGIHSISQLIMKFEKMCLFIDLTACIQCRLLGNDFERSVCVLQNPPCMHPSHLENLFFFSRKSAVGCLLSNSSSFVVMYLNPTMSFRFRCVLNVMLVMDLTITIQSMATNPPQPSDDDFLFSFPLFQRQRGNNKQHHHQLIKTRSYLAIQPATATTTTTTRRLRIISSDPFFFFSLRKLSPPPPRRLSINQSIHLSIYHTNAVVESIIAIARIHEFNFNFQPKPK